MNPPFIGPYFGIGFDRDQVFAELKRKNFVILDDLSPGFGCVA